MKKREKKGGVREKEREVWQRRGKQGKERRSEK